MVTKDYTPKRRKGLHLTQIERGTVKQIKKVNGKLKYFFVYSAEYANNLYKKKRENSRKPFKLATVLDFIKYAECKVLEEGYSPAVVCGRAKLLGLFCSKTSICTKTLYNYIDSCLIKIRNIDLKYKVSRRNKSSKITILTKRVLGLKTVSNRFKRIIRSF